MSESDRANTSPDESAYAKPPRRSGEAGSQESQSRGKSPPDLLLSSVMNWVDLLDPY
jgi:hypothetical protein